MLRLSARAESLPNLPKGYHTFTTAAVQSTKRALYGYFEIRCKPMNSGASSAFWFTHDNGSYETENETEIDVFEICGKGTKGEDYNYYTNVHVFKTPETGKNHWQDQVIWNAPSRLADAYHVCGFYWSKSELIWYFDGNEIRRRDNTYWHHSLTMNFDSETFPNWFGLPDPADLPSVYYIDYIRAWQRLDDGVATIIEGN
jgi:beta-glucanase (GH16 family)